MTSRQQHVEHRKSFQPTGIPCQHSHDAGNADLWLVDDTTQQGESLPAYSPPKNAFSPGDKSVWRADVAETIEKAIDEFSGELRELSLTIHDDPELAFKEYHAHDVLTKFMEEHGFEVERHYLGLETAWRASFTHTGSSSQRPVTPKTLGLNSEMDALPGIGHACGHNLIAIASVAVALALRKALLEHDLPGNIVLLGTPAEESGAGKITLIERGGYKDMDACLMCHPGPGPKTSAGTGSSLAIKGVNVEYFGHTAHASAAPWEGQNALDAAFLAYSAISVLRQQIKPDHRVHGIVQGNDWAPNIIPDYAKMRWLVRAPTAKEVDVLKERVLACFKAAAEATACRIELTETENMFDLRQNSVLAGEFHRVGGERYGLLQTAAEGAIGGSTDFGNVTYEVPALHPSFAIPTMPNGGNHTVLFTEAARRKEAHEATLTVAKTLAHVGIKVLQDEEFLAKVKEAFNPEK